MTPDGCTRACTCDACNRVVQGPWLTLLAGLRAEPGFLFVMAGMIVLPWVVM